MTLEIKPKEIIFLRLAANDVRRSHFIEFLHDNLISIEQTTPPVDNHHLMAILFFTYCPGGQKKPRFGFEARIETITPDKRIFLRRLSEPFACDLRLWPRIRLDLRPVIYAYCQNQEFKIVDISGSSAHFTLPEDDCPSYKVGTIVQIRFVFESGETFADCEITRHWIDTTGKNHLAVQFIGSNEVNDFIKNVFARNHNVRPVKPASSKKSRRKR
ncbi:MAG: hypothetical protein PHN98_08275 [Smithellaceae bacterium]|nr:hypothetical protein [Smithellaceae bacterium]